jgi:cysteine-rich repeat protein
LVPGVALLSHRGGAQGLATETLTRAPIADTYVESSHPDASFGADDRLRADASTERIAYLRFAVSGVNGRPVESAQLRLEVIGPSDSGGTVHLITDNSWDESTVSFSTRPPVDGPGLDTIGAVVVGTIVEFQLDGAIPRDGIYSLAIDSTSSDGVSYVSAEATSGQPPELVITVLVGPAPIVRIVQPPDGSTFFVGDNIPLQATVTDDVDVGLDAHIGWSSDRDGSLGTAAGIAPALSEGSHIVTASVTDSDGFSGSDEIGLTVVPPPPADTEPLVTITAPLDGQTFITMEAVTFTATATDLEDGPLTDSIVWTSDRDGQIGVGGSVATTLGEGIHNVAASVTDSGGLTGSATVTANIVAPEILELVPAADTYVDEKNPRTNYGASTLLRVDADSERIAYLRFVVSGVGVRTVAQATLRMEVEAESGAGSDSGGTVHTISGMGWEEDDVTYDTRPAVDGSSLASVGPVSPGEVVDFDVTEAVPGDGTYDLALVGNSTDGVKYRSKETGTPKLILVLTGNAPEVAITAPTDGTVVFTDSSLPTFSGTATDVEDGDLSSQLLWTSDRDGTLGTGASIVPATLTVGRHAITAAVTDTGNLTGQAQITLVVRTPNVGPEVTITAPTDAAAVPAGTAVPLTVTATDDFDGDLSGQVSWTSDRDGALGTGAALTVTLSEGGHTLSASVVDSDGVAGVDQIAVAITPTAPVVTITAPTDGTAVFAGAAVTFNGTASDVTDGDLSSALTWTSDRHGLIGTGATVGTTALSVGPHIIAATVTDGGGLPGQAQVTVEVRPPNEPPVVTIAAPSDGAAFLTGQPLVLSANATDGEDGDVSGQVMWTSDRDGALGTGAALTVTSLSAGAHTLTASVTDRDGAPGSASVAVTVVESTLTVPAEADTYVDASDPDVAHGAEDTVRADASPEREVYLRFTVTGIPPFAVEQATLRLTVGPSRGHASNSAGTVHRLTGSSWSEASTTFNTRPPIDGPALDSQGAVASDEVVDFDVTAVILGDDTYDFAIVSSSSDGVRYRSREAAAGRPLLIVTLAENTAPVVDITAPPSGTTLPLGTHATCTATAIDAQDGDLGNQIVWSSNLQSALGTGTSVTVTVGPGLDTITAAVTDSSGLRDQAQVTVNVAAQPAVTITAPPDGTVVFTADLPLRFSGTAADVEDGDLSGQLLWTSDRDGALGSGTSIMPATLSVGRHTITAAVSDSDNLVGQAQITVLVPAPNTGPEIAITGPADGTAAPAGTAVRLTATAIDDFDGDLGGQVAWTSSRDGALGVGPALTVTLSEGGHTLSASVVDSDGVAGVDRVAVAITQTAPVVTITAPAEGTTVFAGAAVTCSGTASDATDGDLSGGLTWTSDRDGLIGTGTTVSTTTLTEGPHTVIATVTDGGGLPAQAQVTMLVVLPPHEPPVVTIAAPADGATLLAGQPVVLSATAADSQGGDLSSRVVWTSDRDGPLGAGATLTVTSLSPGRHTLTARVADRDGALGSARVTVGVGLPTVTVVAEADTYVDAGNPGAVHGAEDSFRADASPQREAYLRFAVAGSPPLAVERAILRLTVGPKSGHASKVAGTVYGLTDRSWSEATTTFDTRPTIAGPALDTKGAVGTGEVVDFDVTAAIFGDGTYDFAIITPSSDGVGYQSREATAGQPRLIITSFTSGAPVVRIVSPPDATSVAGPVAFAGTAADAADGDLSNDIRWTSSTDGFLGTGAAIPAIELSRGLHVVTAEVTDSDGLVGSASVSVVVGNAPPLVTVLEPASETSVGVGEPLTLTARAVDAADGDLSPSLRWGSDLNGTIGTGASITTSALWRGRHVITAEATDSEGLTGSAVVIVSVTAPDSRPPDVMITTPTPDAIVIFGAPVTFAATAVGDIDGDLSGNLSWVSDLDGLIGSGRSITTSVLSVGTHEVRAAVTDSAGLVGSTTVEVSVVPPFIRFEAEADVYSDIGEPTTNFGTLPELRVDADAGQRAYLRFTAIDIGSLPIRRAVVRVQATSQSFAGGDHGGDIHSLRDGAWNELTLTHEHRPIIDGLPLSSVGAVAPSETVDFDVTAAIAGDGTYSFAIVPVSGNLALYRSREAPVGRPELIVSFEPPEEPRPTVDIIEPPDRAILSTGVATMFTATVVDVQDGDLGDVIVWTSSVDGTLGRGSSIVPTLTPGSHGITATVSDSDGNTAADLIHVVVGDGPVVAIDVPPDGATVPLGEPIVFTGSAVDPEEGDLSFAVQWSSSIDGALASGPSFTEILSPGRHTITAMVTDSAGNVASATVRVKVTATDVGFQDFSFGSRADIAENDRVTAQKPESKLWHTDGFWWATLFSPAADAYTIHRLDLATQTWISTGVEVDDRPKSRQDVLLDGEKLYVASRLTDTSVQNRLFRYTYHPFAQTYVLDPGFPVDITGGGTESLSIAKDATGTLWIAYTLNDEVVINHTLGSDTRWSTPFVVPVADEDPDAANVLFDDIAAVQALDGMIGVFWSNQLTKKDYFAVHPDGTPPRDQASWRLEVAASGGSIADDHFNMKLASDGRLFVVVKTSYSSSDATLIGLLVRSPDGTWSDLHRVANNASEATRPICLLDEVRRTVRVFYSLGKSAIFTKSSDMDTVAFPDQEGDGTPFIASSTTDDINDPTGTKQNVGPSTGIVVLASSSSGNRYWHNTVDPEPAPVVTIIAPADGLTVPLGASVAFAGTAASVVDGLVSSGLRWTSSIDGAIGSGVSFSPAGLSEGEHVITASVTDSALVTGSARISVIVEADAVPVVTIVRPAAGERFGEGRPITFVGTALDSIDGDLSASLEWVSDRDGVIGTGGGFARSNLSRGVHSITASVTDRQGFTDSDRRTIEVVVEAPPVVTIAAPAHGAVFSDVVPVTFSGTAIDAIDGDVSAWLDWTSSLDGPIGTGATLVTSALSVGLHTITSTSTDSAGRTGSAQLAIEIFEELPPQVEIITPGDATIVLSWQLVTFAGTAIDAIDGNLGSALEWTSNRDGLLGTGPTVTTALSQGLHVIMATATDSAGLDGTAQITLTVETEPDVTILAPAHEVLIVFGESVTFLGAAIDAEDGDLAPGITWTSDRDGLLGIGDRVTATLSLGVHTITASVTDSANLTGTAQITVEVNARPAVTISTPPSGSLFGGGEPVTLIGAATDTEDGDLTASLVWTSSIDGPLGGGGSISATTLTPGTTHTVTVSVSDSSGLSATDRITVVIDVLPTVTITAPADGAVFEAGETVRLTGTAVDVEDGDLTAAIAWTSDLDGPLGGGGSVAIDTLAAGTHAITAAVTDSGGEMGSASITVIVNALPTVTITAPADGAVFEAGETVRLTGTAVDAEDGDLTAAIAWTSDLDGPLGLELLVSVFADRSSAVPLQGETVAGDIHVFMVPETGVQQVWFYLDDPERTGPPEQIDLHAPYDFLGGSISTASPFDTTVLTEGAHVITTVVELTSGDIARTHAQFTVVNAPAVCGDGVVEQGETCDDGNTVDDGNGCDAACQRNNVCGDGTRQAFVEPCDGTDRGACPGLCGPDCTCAPTAGNINTNALVTSGPHTITAAVTDSAGKTASASITVIVSDSPAVTFDTCVVNIRTPEEAQKRYCRNSDDTFTSTTCTPETENTDCSSTQQCAVRPCTSNRDCPSGDDTCNSELECLGGASEGQGCATDADCPDSTCGQAVPVEPADWTSAATAAWFFEDAGDLGRTDPRTSCGGSCDLTNSGTTPDVQQKGEGNSSARFVDAEDDHMRCTDAACGASLDMSGDFTIVARVFSDVAPTRSKNVVKKQSGNSGYTLRFRSTADDLACGVCDGTSCQEEDSTQGLLGSTWTAVACRFTDSANEITVYWNGEAACQSGCNSNLSGSPAGSATDFLLGETATNDWGDGNLDEVAMFGGKALSDAQVCRIARCGLRGEHCLCDGDRPDDYVACSDDGDCGGGRNCNAGTCSGQAGMICTLPRCDAGPP